MFLYEISNQQQAGYVKCKLALHEIFDSNDKYQNNGISWQEPYVTNNLKSAIGASITAEFTDDDKTEIWSHGMTGYRNGVLQCANASIVGSIVDAYVTDINLDGKFIKVLMADCKLDYIRHGAFIDHYRQMFKEHGHMYGSVEITGTAENNNQIVYKDNFTGTGRVPTEYEYSGFALLDSFVGQGDDAAIVVELNAKHTQGGKEIMDMAQLVNEISQKISDEVNSLKDEFKSKKTIEELEAQVSELNERITSLNDTINSKDVTITELNQQIEDIKAEKSTCDKKLSEIEKVNECNSLEEALKPFSEDEKKCVEAEINSFKASPFDSKMSIDEIVTKIKATAFDKIQADKKSSEINSLGIGSLFIDVDMPDETSLEKTEETDIFDI